MWCDFIWNDVKKIELTWLDSIWFTWSAACVSPPLTSSSRMRSNRPKKAAQWSGVLPSWQCVCVCECVCCVRVLCVCVCVLECCELIVCYLLSIVLMIRYMKMGVVVFAWTNTSTLLSSKLCVPNWLVRYRDPMQMTIKQRNNNSTLLYSTLLHSDTEHYIYVINARQVWLSRLFSLSSIFPPLSSPLLSSLLSSSLIV
jgi:hypothetical protein